VPERQAQDPQHPHDRRHARHALPEIEEIEALARQAQAAGVRVRCDVVCQAMADGVNYPVYALSLGNPAPECAAVGFFGGVHGLEHIGAQVVLAGLRGVVTRLAWDATVHHLLEHMHLVFMPLVNPGGMVRRTRANPAGVDLMRNAPVEAAEGAAFMVGGQRSSPVLPWYRGPAGAAMQPEAQALCDVVSARLLPHRFAISLDCHSGFGLLDRLWFPYAHTARPIEHLPELQAFRKLLDQSLLHHRYVFEPQSRHYLTHGDLWDHLHLQSMQAVPGSQQRVFLPLTLEMGSWLWVKKNPRQLFTRAGIFNPLIEHRQQRVLRRHLGLLDFVMRAALSFQRWLPPADEREAHRQAALDHWYRLDRR
jgi:hypothetical protein